MKSTLTAIAIIVCCILIARCAKCDCGCWRWCSCKCRNCSCSTSEHMYGFDPRNIDIARSIESFVGISGSHGGRFVNLKRTVHLHYTDWCGACKLMKPVWEQVKVAVSGSGVTFDEINEDNAKTPGISGYPTILMLDERGHTIKYSGGPDFETLRNWVVAPNHFR